MSFIKPLPNKTEGTGGALRASRNNDTAKLASHTDGALRKLPNFPMGDFVRVPHKRNVYSKGYTTNWNWELFKIQKK